MVGLLTFLLIVGLFLYLIWYFFFRSILWVAEPLIKHFESREAEKFIVEDLEEENMENIDLEKIPKNKVKLTLKDFDKPIHLSKSLLEKARKEPQKIPNINLWVYRDYIFPTKPTTEKIKEIFGEERKSRND
jgi:hypothetical protein